MDWTLPRVRPGAFAVWRRNALVWRKQLGPSMAVRFGEPLIYLLGLGYGLGLFIGDMAGIPYLMFLASGIVASSAMTTASFEAMYSVHTRMVPQRTYEHMLATPLDLDDILAGELLWCATKGLISAVAILIVAALLGAVHGPQALWVLPVSLLIGLAFAAPALIMTAVSPNYDFFNYYFTVVITPMFVLCGVFYPVQALPEPLQWVVTALPLTHAVELVRPLVAGTPVANPVVHVLVLCAYAAIGYYIAVVLIRRRMVV